LHRFPHPYIRVAIIYGKKPEYAQQAAAQLELAAGMNGKRGFWYWQPARMLTFPWMVPIRGRSTNIRGLGFFTPYP